MKSKIKKQPVSKIEWIDRNKLKANDYNPNTQGSPEFTLLKTSILEDGWTQPIVINPDYTIVDGFHRWSISKEKEVFEMTNGYVPVVILEPKDISHQKMSTIRHNRARGSHGVLKMGVIVKDLIDEGKSINEIMERLQMEREEVERLAITQGVTDMITGDFSKSW